MKNVMARAWEIARAAAKKYGGRPVEYMRGGAVKGAWQEEKVDPIVPPKTLPFIKYKVWAGQTAHTALYFALEHAFDNWAMISGESWILIPENVTSDFDIDLSRYPDFLNGEDYSTDYVMKKLQDMDLFGSGIEWVTAEDSGIFVYSDIYSKYKQKGGTDSDLYERVKEYRSDDTDETY